MSHGVAKLKEWRPAPPDASENRQARSRPTPDGSGECYRPRGAASTLAPSAAAQT